MSKKIKKTDKTYGNFEFVSPKDGNVYHLTIKEKRFCEAYLEAFGNGVKAVFEAGYKVKNALVAKSIAYNLLTNAHIIAYVDSLLEKYGFDEENVIKHHLYLLNQFGDLTNKAKAVDMFYKIKGRYAPTKIYTEPNPLDDLTDEELEEKAEELTKKINKLKNAKPKNESAPDKRGIHPSRTPVKKKYKRIKHSKKKKR